MQDSSHLGTDIPTAGTREELLPPEHKAHREMLEHRQLF